MAIRTSALFFLPRRSKLLHADVWGDEPAILGHALATPGGELAVGPELVEEVEQSA